jgi:hypothetical protein
MTAPSERDALRYVLSNIDDARGHLEQAQAALATATAYGRISIAGNGEDDDEGGE